MIPSAKWFPSGLQDRVAWYDNFSNQVSIIGLGPLGLGAADGTQIGADAALMDFCGQATQATDAFQEAVRQFRKIMTEGVNGTPSPNFPTLSDLTPPPGPLTGVFERLDGYVRRIKAAPGYNAEIGGQLGIVGSTPVIQPIDQMKPKLKVSTFPGNLLRVEFTRGHTDGIQLQAEYDNEGAFEDVGIFPKSPVQFTVPPNDKNLPRFVMLRGRYLDGNTPTSDWSDITSLSTVPS